MKKLFSILILACALFAQGYSQEASDYDYKIGYSGTWLTYSMPTGTNATTATDSTWFYTVLKETDMPLRYDIKLICDSVSGTHKTVPIVLKGKKFLSDSWTTLQTVYWVTGVDTVKTFTQATPGQYRYYQVYTRSNNKGFVFRFPELSFMFYKQ